MYYYKYENISYKKEEIVDVKEPYTSSVLGFNLKRDSNGFIYTQIYNEKSSTVEYYADTYDVLRMEHFILNYWKYGKELRCAFDTDDADGKDILSTIITSCLQMQFPNFEKSEICLFGKLGPSLNTVFSLGQFCSYRSEPNIPEMEGTYLIGYIKSESTLSFVCKNMLCNAIFRGFTSDNVQRTDVARVLQYLRRFVNTNTQASFQYI